MRTALLALLLVFLLVATEASAQTTPTFGEKAVGSTDCKNGAFAADFDTLAQCTSTSSTTGTMQKAPIFVGAVTSPPYPSTTCDSSKAGMMQYTASAMQYCNGTAWTGFGAVASGYNAQSIISGWPDAIVCSNGSTTKVLSLIAAPYGDGTYFYDSVNYFRVVFTSAGAYSSNLNLTGFNCLSKSISTLVAEGKAFNIANGQAGGTAEMQDGTAGAPGLYFSADPNTGFYRPAADTVAIATNGSEKVRINASGQVALNSITPTAGAILDLAAGTGTALSSMIVPKDTTANRPTTGVEGMIRYNTTTKAFEGYQGSTPAWAQMAKAAESLTTSTATASWTLNPGSYGSVTGGVSDIIDTSTGTTMVLRTDVSTIDWLGGTSATTFAGPTSSSCAVYKLDFGAGARGRAYVSVTVDPEQTSGNICAGWGVGTVFAIYSTDTSYTSGCTFANGSQVVNFSVVYNGCGDPPAVTSTGGGFFLGRYLYLIAAGTRNSWEGNYMNGRGKATINVLDVRLE